MIQINKYILILIIGIIAGITESALGISFAIIPLLLLTNVIIDYKVALGTTLCAFLFPLSVGAVYIHYRKNNVEIDSAIILGISYFIGASCAAKYIVEISNESLMLFAGIFLLILSMYYFYKYYNCS